MVSITIEQIYAIMGETPGTHIVVKLCKCPPYSENKRAWTCWTTSPSGQPPPGLTSEKIHKGSKTLRTDVRNGTGINIEVRGWGEIHVNFLPIGESLPGTSRQGSSREIHGTFHFIDKSEPRRCGAPRALRGVLLIFVTRETGCCSEFVKWRRRNLAQPRKNRQPALKTNPSFSRSSSSFGKKDIFFLVMNEPDLVVDTFGRSNTCTQLGGSGNDSGAKGGIFGQTNNGEVRIV
jgi:hypothetical protein